MIRELEKRSEEAADEGLMMREEPIPTGDELGAAFEQFLADRSPPAGPDEPGVADECGAADRRAGRVACACLPESRRPGGGSRRGDETGAETALLDLRELALPMYDPDDEGEPTPAVSQLSGSCATAPSGMLWSSPMYRGRSRGRSRTRSTGFTCLSDREPPFLYHDKVVGLISAAGGTQGLQAINTMEFSSRALRAWAVPYVVPVGAA